MGTNRYRQLLLRDIEDGFSRTLPAIIGLCKRSGDLKLSTGNIKAGLVRIRHAYMPEFHNPEFTPESSLLGRYTNVKGELDGEAQYADNNILALVEAITEEHRRLTTDGVPDENLEIYLAMLMKNIHDIGMVNYRVWKWQQTGLLRKVDTQIQHSLDDFDEGAEIIFSGLPARPVNLTRAESLTNGFFVQIINPDKTLSQIKHVKLEEPSGMFLATSNNPYTKFSSIADLVVEMVDGRVIRVEVKAWQKMTFSFDGNDLPVITDITENSLRQGYRYLFESVFRHNDMKTLSYAIPEKTSDAGIKPEHVRKMLQGLMNPKSKTLLKELIGTNNKSKLSFSANMSGRDHLASKAFEAALAEDDVTILNVMKKWDQLLAESPDEFPDCAPFADGAFDTLSLSLQSHLATPAKTFGSGIVLVESIEK